LLKSALQKTIYGVTTWHPAIDNDNNKSAIRIIGKMAHRSHTDQNSVKYCNFQMCMNNSLFLLCIAVKQTTPHMIQE